VEVDLQLATRWSVVRSRFDREEGVGAFFGTLVGLKNRKGEETPVVWLVLEIVALHVEVAFSHSLVLRY